jgi:hypothetical protein
VVNNAKGLKVNNAILWQSMKLEYFIALVTRNALRLTLQSINRKSDYEEARQHGEIVNAICNELHRELCDKDDVKKIEKKLMLDFESIDRNTYLCCFYNVSAPSANLVRLFGGDSGISVGFDKDLIEKAVCDKNRDAPSNDKCKCAQIEYIENDIGLGTGEMDDKNMLAEKLKGFTRTIKPDDGESWRYDVSVLQNLIVQYLFAKSANYKDEHEYRIIYGQCPTSSVQPDSLEPVPLPRNAIRKIAIRSANYDAMCPVVDFLSKNTEYTFTAVSNDYYDHPLQIFDVTPKRTDHKNCISG